MSDGRVGRVEWIERIDWIESIAWNGRIEWIERIAWIQRGLRRLPARLRGSEDARGSGRSRALPQSGGPWVFGRFQHAAFAARF